MRWNHRPRLLLDPNSEPGGGADAEARAKQEAIDERKKRQAVEAELADLKKTHAKLQGDFDGLTKEHEGTKARIAKIDNDAARVKALDDHIAAVVKKAETEKTPTPEINREKALKWLMRGEYNAEKLADEVKEAVAEFMTAGQKPEMKIGGNNDHPDPSRERKPDVFESLLLSVATPKAA